MDLVHGDKLIRRFFTTYFVVFKQKLRLPLYQHYPNLFLIKERRKRDRKFFHTRGCFQPIPPLVGYNADGAFLVPLSKRCDVSIII